MNLTRSAQTLFLAAVATFVLSAHAQDSARPTYSLRLSQVLGGTIQNTTIASRAPYPLNKKYEEFSDEEKQRLRSYYEGMPATDDPPFPLGGMKKIVADLAQVASQFQADESVTILVAISETGVATAVKIIGEPTLELAKAVAYVLVQARYKPAKCNGLPCAQEFPFRLHLTTR